MKIIKTVAEWQSIRKDYVEKMVGYVPTMGCLHEGHESLLQRSKEENEITTMSIFVNPTQFDEKEDYEHYPRQPEVDLAIAEKNGVDYVLLPEEKEMYPNGCPFQFSVSDPFINTMEGIGREGHFSGVLNVVLKFFSIIRPNRAYLGEKDYQQYYLLKLLADTFFLSVDVIGCPIKREDSGLPLSSRLTRLKKDERILANETARLIHTLNKGNKKEISQQLEAKGVKVEYLEIHKNRAFSAIRIGSIRLIDNFELQN